MFSFELHHLFADLTLYLFIIVTITGIMMVISLARFVRIPSRMYKMIRIVHIILGILAFVFFLLTYLLAPIHP
jgi:hypothetical protein